MQGCERLDCGEMSGIEVQEVKLTKKKLLYFSVFVRRNMTAGGLDGSLVQGSPPAKKQNKTKRLGGSIHRYTLSSLEAEDTSTFFLIGCSPDLKISPTVERKSLHHNRMCVSLGVPRGHERQKEDGQQTAASPLCGL